MPLPLSLQQPFRKGQLFVGGGWRGFFAAFNAALSASSNNTTAGPRLIDLQVQGPFNESAPPAGYFDMGWITEFKMTPASKIGSVRSGFRGAVRAKYRGEVGETFEFSFREMTRMAYKIATGSEVFNLLANPNAAASALGPLSSSGALAVPVGASGYLVNGVAATLAANVPTLCVPAGSGAAFPAGSLIVADDDYAGQFGLVGAAGINVYNGAVASDGSAVDFIRKTSDFVARVVLVVPNVVAGQDGLVLSKPFVGGGNASIGTPLYGPGPNAKVQLIKGWLAREGGTYLTEWSGLFCCDTVDGSQIALYYPHVAPNQFKDFGTYQIENAGTTDLTGYKLDCVMEAMAYDDPLDGETVVRYAAYYPAPSSAATQN